MVNDEIQKLRFQGLGYKKIAQELGISENTVKSFCRRNPIDKSKKICMQCGKPIIRTPHKREKKFCSDKCRLDWWKEHPELINKKAVYQFTCIQCGQPFESYGNDKRKYCSRSCFATARRKVAESNE